MSTSASSSEYPSSVLSLVSPIPYGPDESLPGGLTRGSYDSESISQHNFEPHPNAEGILVGLGLNQERGNSNSNSRSGPRRTRNAPNTPINSGSDEVVREPEFGTVPPPRPPPTPSSSSISPLSSISRQSILNDHDDHSSSILGSAETRNSSGGNQSFDFGSIVSGNSESSGKTIYVDAEESVSNTSGPSEVSLNPRYSQGLKSSSSSYGLVTVTPMRAALHQDSNLSSSRLDFSANKNRGIESGDFHGSRSAGASSAYKASPLTSRRRTDPRTDPRTDLRTDPRTDPHNLRNPHQHQKENDLGSPKAHSLESPKPQKKRRPLGIIYNAKGREKRNGFIGPSQKPPTIDIQFGRPRDTSSNASQESRNVSQTSQADSLASVDGHLHPNRRVKEHPVSLIRRSGSRAYGATHFFAGMPHAPYLFNPEADPSSPLLFSGRRCDMWGRNYVPLWISVLLLLACTLFPPLWLLLGAGYFDRSLGPIPQKVKLAALALALLSFGGLTAVSIVICITQRG